MCVLLAWSATSRYLRGFGKNTKPRELSLDERIKLVEDLWDSIAAEQEVLHLTDEQWAELDRRLDACRT